MNSPLIILFNGPPGAGKDMSVQLCQLLVEEGSIPFLRNKEILTLKLAQPLKEATAALFGLTHWNAQELEVLKDLKSLKSTKKPLFSLREAYIDMSEKFVKQVYGEDFFGVMAVEAIKKSKADVVLISDGGFNGEILPFIREFGPTNIHVVHLYRQGKTFSEDSRNYINLEELKNTTYLLTNDSSVFNLKIRIKNLLDNQILPKE